MEKTGVDYIKEERTRQIETKGYNSIQDDPQTIGSLATAAACYAIPISLRWAIIKFWPYEVQYYKPSIDEDKEGRIKELSKAGALIAAEIDRLLRLSKK